MLRTLLCAVVLLYPWTATAQQPFQVAISLTTDPNGGRPRFTGRTNLPDGMELIVTLEDPSLVYMAQDKVTVAAGHFRTVAFSDDYDPVVPGSYLIEITGSAAAQPQQVKALIGSHGQLMRGPFVITDTMFGMEQLVDAKFSFFLR